MEENKKMSKSTKIILGILIAIVCICVAFFAMSNIKKSKIKKEYKDLLENGMDNISQDYNLSKVNVQVRGTVKTRFFFVFCSVISNLYLSPSLTISESRRLRISDILSPRFPSRTRAVAIRSLGRQPQNPSLMV